LAYAAWRWNYERTRTTEHFVPSLIDEQGRLTTMDVVVPPWRIWLRYLQLAAIFVPLVLTYPLTSMNKMFEAFWLAWFLRSIERAGPAFIKLAQWLATRRDLASPRIREELGKLFNRVPAHGMEHTRAVLVSDFGKELEELFCEFDESPVGSGSIAQVHVARFRDDPSLGDLAGKKVAVKVAHPKIVQRIAVDFHVLNGLARLADRLFPSLHWLELPRQTLAWTEFLAQQVDLRLEARNLDSFIENFKNTDDQVFCCFPRPYRPWVSQNVLVEEFINGHTADYDYIAKLPFDLRHQIASIGMESYLKCLLRDNWLHGDMHPGNIIIANETEPGKKWPKVYLIDAGLCLKLDKEQGELSRKLLSGFARWKVNDVAEALWGMGPNGGQALANYEELHENLTEVLAFYQECSGEHSAVVGRVLESCFDVVRSHKMQMEAWATNLLFGVLVAESFVMTLDDHFNIVKRVLPWLVAEGNFSWGMFRNQFGWIPWFVKEPDRSKEMMEKLRAKGQLTIEGDNHESWDHDDVKDKSFKGGLLGSQYRSA